MKYFKPSALFVVALIGMTITLSAVGISQDQTPAPAPADTLTIGLPPIAVPHALANTLLGILSVLFMLEQYFGWNKKIPVNSTSEWLVNLVSGIFSSLRNAHAGNGGLAPPPGTQTDVPKKVPVTGSVAS